MALLGWYWYILFLLLFDCIFRYFACKQFDCLDLFTSQRFVSNWTMIKPTAYSTHSLYTSSRPLWQSPRITILWKQIQCCRKVYCLRKSKNQSGKITAKSYIKLKIILKCYFWCGSSFSWRLWKENQPYHSKNTIQAKGGGMNGGWVGGGESAVEDEYATNGGLLLPSDDYNVFAGLYLWLYVSGLRACFVFCGICLIWSLQRAIENGTFNPCNIKAKAYNQFLWKRFACHFDFVIKNCLWTKFPNGTLIF